MTKGRFTLNHDSRALSLTNTLSERGMNDVLAQSCTDCPTDQWKREEYSEYGKNKATGC